MILIILIIISRPLCTLSNKKLTTNDRAAAGLSASMVKRAVQLDEPSKHNPVGWTLYFFLQMALAVRGRAELPQVLAMGRAVAERLEQAEAGAGFAYHHPKLQPRDLAQLRRQLLQALRSAPRTEL